MIKRLRFQVDSKVSTYNLNHYHSPEDQDNAFNRGSVTEGFTSLQNKVGNRITGKLLRSYKDIKSNNRNIQRVISVKPDTTAADEVVNHFNYLCPTGRYGRSGHIITDNCESSSNNSCDCVCDTSSDTTRTYTINVKPAVGSSKIETLHDGSSEVIPESSMWPSTEVGDNPVITTRSNRGSSIEFGFFKPNGRGEWYDNWRILAHELCGHARLKQSYSGTTGDRPGHDVTIETENAIAGEHGSPPRGKYSDRRQGEAFYNMSGDRSRVVFLLNDGWHFESP